jgi:hypothetical protein
MTTQEVREEMKNLEGDPHIKARRRQVQRQLAMNQMAKAVPKADVVVTNPTELAVAIQYQPQEMAAPIVLAKGAGVLAQRIRQLWRTTSRSWSAASGPGPLPRRRHRQPIPAAIRGRGRSAGCVCRLKKESPHAGVTKVESRPEIKPPVVARDGRAKS